MKIKNLPEDMQVLLMQMSEESGHRIWEDDEVEAGKRFLDVELPVVDLRLEAFPEFGAEDLDVERPIDPYVEMDPLDFPPVVVAHGQFMDGRHRVLASRIRRDAYSGEPSWIRTMDASRVIRPKYAKRWSLGPLRKKFIDTPKETGATRDSLANARELIIKYGLPDTVTAITTSVDWYVQAKWSDGLLYIFEGFSWGYRGEGPRGMESFFGMIGMDPPIAFSEIEKWPLPEKVRIIARPGPLEWSPQSWKNKFIRGLHYGKDWE